MSFVIAFTSQKGGVGKSSLTMICATYLHLAGNKILILDADYPQFSCTVQRQNDLFAIEKDAKLQAAFEKLEREPYSIVSIKLEMLKEKLETTINSSEYDFIFIDFPGTLNNNSIAEIVPYINLAIIPMSVEALEFASGIDAANYYRETNPTISLHVLWNRIVKTENELLRSNLTNFLTNKCNLHVLENRLYNTVEFKRLRSTIFMYPGEVISNFMEEIFDLYLKAVKNG